ncbi:MAG: helix-turn-helix domain-containing protein [Firmicutes bacterium]|nr:helix-turn-helix domain-containing protein [Bacillota bacterium]
MECIQRNVSELPLILSVKDVRKLLGIASNTAYALFSRSDFPAIKIGRRKLVARDDFFEWLSRQTNISA